ncbi:MAG TPA: glycosyltransferase family 4 protein [Terracidiphilus sp.]|nr:glycosyltransferase family 4 protein [Terracidiphilus sp.]
MPTSNIADRPIVTEPEIHGKARVDTESKVELGLLTGCKDRHYAFGLAMALVAEGVSVEVVGSDEIDSPELHNTSNLRFLNFLSGQRNKANFAKKLSRTLAYYWRLSWYVAHTKSRVLHILWNNKFELCDRTLLMFYYRALGKKIALTAHNVNQAARDGNDSILNRVTLGIQYRLCDHIFVHTQKMKKELCDDFRVTQDAVTVIPYPMNNALPETQLTPAEAKRRLGLKDDEKAVLFFGRIRPYKGIEHLLAAFKLLATVPGGNYRLIIAGEPKKGSEEYLHEIEQFVAREFDAAQVILKIQFIPDSEMEQYFKAGDVLILPYKEIFQSGVLFLAYGFGLPVIATDVGSFRDDIVEGYTGFLCKPGDPKDMARAIETYFASDLFKNLKTRRSDLIDYVNTNHSWRAVAELTHEAYTQVLRRSRD